MGISTYKNIGNYIKYKWPNHLTSRLGLIE